MMEIADMQIADMQDKYLGCIVGAAAGDALGAATELYPAREIARLCYGRVTDFMAPLPGAPAYGRRAGQVTDAFSIAYILMNHMIASPGNADRITGSAALLGWGKSEWFEPFAGMTTRAVVNALMDETRQDAWAYSGRLGNKLFKSHYYALSSNGSAVKAWPAALLHPSDIDATIATTVELTMASHDDPLSISGACAISAAVCEALKKTTKLYDIICAAQYGAKRGEELARAREDIWVYPGPSVQERIKMAIDLAVRHGDGGMGALRDLIGCGPGIAETVPVALGLLATRGGNVMEALFDGANIGDETAAIASLVGAIGGAWKGHAVFPNHFLPTIDRENAFDLRRTATEMLKLGLHTT